MDKNVIPFPDKYEFDMGIYFSRGWQLFKLGSGSFIGFSILFIVIIVVVSVTPLISVVSGLFQYLLMAGVYIFCRNLLKKKDEFSQFFRGFNYFIQILIFFLIISFFLLPLSYILTNQILPPGLLEQYMAGEVRPAEVLEVISSAIEANYNYVMLLLTLIIIISLYLHISYSFTLPLIADSELQFWDAMEASRKIIAQKFFHFLGMYLLLGVIIFISTVITCGFGLIVSLPFSLCVIFSAYDEIVYPPSEAKDELTNNNVNFA